MWCEHIQTVFRVSPGPDSGPGQRRRTRARPGTSSRSHGQINLSLFSAQPRSDAQPLAEARGAEHRSSAPVRPLVKFTLLTCAPLQRHTELSSVSSSALAAPCGTSYWTLQTGLVFQKNSCFFLSLDLTLYWGLDVTNSTSFDKLKAFCAVQESRSSANQNAEHVVLHKL